MTTESGFFGPKIKLKRIDKRFIEGALISDISEISNRRKKITKKVTFDFDQDGKQLVEKYVYDNKYCPSFNSDQEPKANGLKEFIFSCHVNDLKQQPDLPILKNEDIRPIMRKDQQQRLNIKKFVKKLEKMDKTKEIYVFDKKYKFKIENMIHFLNLTDERIKKISPTIRQSVEDLKDFVKNSTELTIENINGSLYLVDNDKIIVNNNKIITNNDTEHNTWLSLNNNIRNNSIF